MRRSKKTAIAALLDRLLTSFPQIQPVGVGNGMKRRHPPMPGRAQLAVASRPGGRACTSGEAAHRFGGGAIHRRSPPLRRSAP
jgi:hypothetical protein